MSRWERWANKPQKGNSLKSFIKEQQSPAELARSMGLQSDGSGGYIDPSTGEVVARTVNNELVFYDPMGGAISAQSGGAELTQAQPSWRDPVTGELTVPPGQAESPEEIAAIPDPVPALAPASYNAFMNAKKKEMYAMQGTPEQEEIDDIQQEVDPQLGMEEEVLTYKKLMEMPQRRRAGKVKVTHDPQIAADWAAAQKKDGPNVVPGPVRTSDQPLDTAPKTQVVKAKKDGEIAAATPPRPATAPAPSRVPTASAAAESFQQESADNQRDMLEVVNEQLAKRYKLQSKRDSAITQFYDPLKKLLDGIENPDERDRKTRMFVNALSTRHKINHGTNNLTGSQYQGLKDRRSMLEGLDVDGDGNYDFDRIRNFKNSQIMHDDIDDDYVKSTYGLLPESVVESLTHKSKTGLNDEQIAALKEKYPLAIERGKGKGRHLDYSPIFWKQYLQTGGIDAYTGLPLDINELNIEHMIPGSDGLKNDELADWVEDPENKVLVHRGPNQKRGNKTLKQFLDTTLENYDPASNDLYDFIADAEHGLQGAKEKTRNYDIENLSNLMLDFGKNGKEGGIFNPNMNEETYQQILSTHQKQYDAIRDTVLKAISDRFDTGRAGHYKLTPKKLEAKIEELKLDEHQAHRMRTLHDVYKKALGLKPDFGKIRKNLTVPGKKKALASVPRTEPAHGGRATGSSDNADLMEKLFRNTFFGKDRKAQEKMKSAWNDAITSGSNASRTIEKDGVEPEYWRNRERTQFAGLKAFHNALKSSGFLDDGILDQEEYAALKRDIEYHQNTSEEDHLKLWDQQEMGVDKNDKEIGKGRWFANYLKSLQQEGFEIDEFELEDEYDESTPLDKLLQAISILMDSEGSISSESPRLNFSEFRDKMNT